MLLRNSQHYLMWSLKSRQGRSLHATLSSTCFVVEGPVKNQNLKIH
jgi:hypothetical protein